MKILCKIFGHKWTVGYLDVDDAIKAIWNPNNHLVCRRCGKKKYAKLQSK